MYLKVKLKIILNKPNFIVKINCVYLIKQKLNYELGKTKTYPQTKI